MLLLFFSYLRFFRRELLRAFANRISFWTFDSLLFPLGLRLVLPRFLVDARTRFFPFLEALLFLVAIVFFFWAIAAFYHSPLHTLCALDSVKQCRKQRPIANLTSRIVLTVISFAPSQKHNAGRFRRVSYSPATRFMANP